ncbi:MAG TPA: hypothetical protein PLP42_00060 [Acidobacteriota bacterium]|nr:hypothetical protein [Acidobacteriota bacterium]
MESAIKWIIWFALMTLVMRWLARSRSRSAKPANSKLLYHPTSTLVLGLVGGGFFLALAILSYVFANDTGTLGISLFFAGFALLGFVFVWEYFRVRHSLEPGGMRYQKLLSNGGKLRWNEVTRVHYSQSAKWFRLVTKTGEVVRVSAMLVGLPEFARAVLDEVPSESIDTTTRDVLRETAAGHPPSLWA